MITRNAQPVNFDMIYENYNVYDPPHIKLGGHTRGVQVCALYVIHNQ